MSGSPGIASLPPTHWELRRSITKDGAGYWEVWPTEPNTADRLGWVIYQHPSWHASNEIARATAAADTRDEALRAVGFDPGTPPTNPNDPNDPNDPYIW